MRSWKRRYRAKLKMVYQIHINSESDNYDPQFRISKRYRRRSKSDHRLRENEVRNETATKRFYEDCDCHPCKIATLDIEGDDITGTSLIDGTSPRSCSLHSCGVVFFTEEEATRRADYIKHHGWDQYFENYDAF